MTGVTVDTWLTWLRAGDASPGTLRIRGSHIRILSRSIDLLSATEDDLVGFLTAPGLANETRRSRRSSVKSFYGWARRTGLIETDPTEGLKTIRQRNRIPKPVPEDILATALANASDEQRLMLLLGAYAGLRRSEIAAVHGDDVTDTALTVAGKGGKTRTIPLHPRLRADLAGVRGWAFPSPLDPKRPASHDYIASRLEAILPRPWTPHSLRHRAATQWFRASKDITQVQALLGHSSVETTMLYVLVDNDALLATVTSIA